ncbi:MAG TPA: YkvA family protein [Hyphomicrobium sp.]|nr:YkvA family protein [Hyphomicrobium sp.]
MLEKIKAWARALKAEIAALAGAVRDARTPWYAKALGVVIVGYALSPIDLIPDFIPVIGFLDDAILLPIGIWAVLRMIPQEVMDEHRAGVAAGTRLPPNRVAAAVIIGLWIASLILAAWWLRRYIAQ